jgi:hypothetical protein
MGIMIYKFITQGTGVIHWNTFLPWFF